MDHTNNQYKSIIHHVHAHVVVALLHLAYLHYQNNYGCDNILNVEACTNQIRLFKYTNLGDV